MGKLVSIGEALIDFIPGVKGERLKDVTDFRKCAGGAPANVACCVAKLGGQARFITQLGVDAFGDYLVETIGDTGVQVDSIIRTDQALTGLAFVSLTESGERDFAFFRKPSADMLLDKDEIQREWFDKGDILHFCSVDLIEAPVKYAHLQTIQYAKDFDMLISFDPNIRLALWDDAEQCRETVRTFLPYAHILKVSDEELPFITGIDDIEESLQSLFVGNVIMVIYTMGADGVRVLTRDRTIDSIVKGYKATVRDTTGAGDSFIGSFLYQLLKANVTVESIGEMGEQELRDMLKFSNACAAIVVGEEGVIPILPTVEQVDRFMK